jgi:3'(2'), 5'-bisphosphate nucleotidase
MTGLLFRPPPDIELAIAAVRESAVVARAIRAEWSGAALSKPDASPVTVADFAVQALVARRLVAGEPGAVLVAEERAAALRRASGSETLARIVEFVSRRVPDATPDAVCDWIDLGAGSPSHRFWTLDPIDGTKGFLSGGQYAVALARVEGGIVQVGIIACPALVEGHREQPGGAGTLAIGIREGGAWWAPIDGDGRWRALQVSGRRRGRDGRIIRSRESRHTDTARTDELSRRLAVRGQPRLMDSLAKCVVIAAGYADVLVRFPPPDRPAYRDQIWDLAAGEVIVHEAGGRTTDLAGRPLDFAAGRTLERNRGLVVTNGLLHEQVLRAAAGP